MLALDSLTELLDALPAGAVLKSAQSRVVVYVNRAAVRLLESTEHDLVGQPLDAIWSPESAIEQHRRDHALLEEDTVTACLLFTATLATGKLLQLSAALVRDDQQLPTYLLYLLHEPARDTQRIDSASAQSPADMAKYAQLADAKSQLETLLNEAQHRLAIVSGRHRVALVEWLMMLENLQTRRDSQHLSGDIETLAERARNMLTVVDDAIITTFGVLPSSQANATGSDLLSVVQGCLKSLDMTARAGGSSLTVDEANLKNRTLQVNPQILKLLLIQLLSALLTGRDQPRHIHISADHGDSSNVVMHLTVQASREVLPAIQRQIAGPNSDRRRNNIRFAVAACHLIKGDFELEPLTPERLRINLRFPDH